ncbi:uncharacterized protein LOC131163525 [Malania oleifera]|uniref:uncharacterized protein LOC131163525 n=1 Tax=Malania oleifera TaxID=397392 RepID=UPI0025ADAFEE|nr:uncharacterized protein LOC131163525 [Malania oleifera]
MFIAEYLVGFSMLGMLVSYDDRVLKQFHTICRIDPGNSSAHTGEDDAGPSSMGGRDPDVVLRSVTQQVMTKMARGSEEWSCMIEQLTRIKPPSFSRGASPLMAENWVQDIEDMLAVLPCTDEQKVLFATYKLTREAKQWWRLVRLLEKQKPDPVAETWSHFREIFFKRYFPATIRSVKAAVFLHLTHGPMAV